MSYNEQLIRVLISEHQRELRDEAAQERLAREARGNHTPWWRRLAGLPAPGDHRGPRHRPAPVLTSAGPRVGL